MTKKILWMLLSFLLVVSLVLTSCAKEEVVVEEDEEEEEVVEEEEEEEEEVVAPPVGEPQYGGTLTLMGNWVHCNPQNWDVVEGSGWSLLPYLPPVMEHLLTGDLVKYGPRGTNEFSFGLCRLVSDDVMTGQLVESWEVTTDPLGVCFHIRPGVMWTGNSRIDMEPREYTAYDAAWCLNRLRASSWASWLLPYLRGQTADEATEMEAEGEALEEDAFEALDKYTLQAYFNEVDISWPNAFGWGEFGFQYPPEVVEANAADWRNQVGTGPFIVANYVSGSQVVYERNPNWWDKKQIIDGKEYDVPFIDKLVYPIIVDTSTQIAALRTGKIDLAHDVKSKYKDTLHSTSPELILKANPAGGCTALSWVTGKEGTDYPNPDVLMSDVNLRRAMMIGTDLNAIVVATMEEGYLPSWPLSSGFPHTIYTPLEDLPPASRELFEYDPVKAKQMLADAGYPDGFKLKLDYVARDIWSDIAALLEDQWAKIGVELILQPHDDATLAGMIAEDKIVNASMWGMGTLGGQRNFTNAARAAVETQEEGLASACDQYFINLALRAGAEMDADKREPMTKELGILELNQCWALTFGEGKIYTYWWPWVKNYYGEVSAARLDTALYASLLWIDQDLKEAMGY